MTRIDRYHNISKFIEGGRSNARITSSSSPRRD